jgi:hypothetical protein
VIYGGDGADGGVSFIAEHGTHAGPASAEMHTFIVGPAGAGLPRDVSHPMQLYEFFMRYQVQSRPPPDLSATV